MGPNTSLLSGMTVDQVLNRWEQTASVFVRLRMACVGCPMSPFETLDAVAEIYGLPVEKLVNQLEQAISAGTLQPKTTFDLETEQK